MLHNSPTHYSNLVETTSGYFSMFSQNSCKVTVWSALFRYLKHNHYCSIRVSPGTRSQKQDIYLGFQGNQDIYLGRRSVPKTKIYILVWESMGKTPLGQTFEHGSYRQCFPPVQTGNSRLERTNFPG